MNNESYDFEDRKYVNPTLSRDEQLSFVDNFREAQQSNMDQIARDTHNLGTDVPSNLGGLSGSEGLWKASYVTPKVDSMISGLRASAQAKALNDVLSNYQEQMKKRYNDAYMAYQKRNNNGSGGSDGGNGGSDEDDDDDLSWLNPSPVSVDPSKTTPNYSAITGTHHYSFDAGGGFTFEVDVTYDEFGKPIKVDAGRNGVYEGDDAEAYLNKLQSNYALK